ncbi:MAG: redoxin domain-containing protein [Flavobacteriaceae bacterium]
MNHNFSRFLGLTALLILASCNKNSYTIQGNASAVADSTMVYLQVIENQTQQKIIDSTQVFSGVFAFEGEQELPEMHYVLIENLNGAIPVVLEPGAIKVDVPGDNLREAKSTGTPQNDLLQKFMQETLPFSERAMGISMDMSQAQASMDQESMNALREEYGVLQNEVQLFELNFIKQHPDGLISLLVLERIFASMMLPVSEVSGLFESLSEPVKKSSTGVLLAEQLKAQLNTSVGAKAPDFEGPSPEGKSIKLYENLGKVTLVDFWAAWCKPCRAQNPELVELYNKYQKDGFQIIGVSLDKEKKDWMEAIEQDGLTWPQLSHLKLFDGPIVALYNIRAIPSSIILDENGVIIAKDLRGPELVAQLTQLFGY